MNLPLPEGPGRVAHFAAKAAAGNVSPTFRPTTPPVKAVCASPLPTPTIHLNRLTLHPVVVQPQHIHPVPWFRRPNCSNLCLLCHLLLHRPWCPLSLFLILEPCWCLQWHHCLHHLFHLLLCWQVHHLLLQFMRQTWFREYITHRSLRLIWLDCFRCLTDYLAGNVFGINFLFSTLIVFFLLYKSIGLHAVWKGVGRSHTSCGQLHFKVGPGFYLTVPRGNTHTFDALTHKKRASFFFIYLYIHYFVHVFFPSMSNVSGRKTRRGSFSWVGACDSRIHDWNLPASYTFLKWTLLAIFFTHNFLVMCAGVWHFFSLSFSPLSSNISRSLSLDAQYTRNKETFLDEGSTITLMLPP